MKNERWAGRRLGVVMFLDMAKYSAHMAKNEAHAMSRLQNLSALLSHEVPEHGGHLVKFLGDGTIAEFPTAMAAVTCAQTLLNAIHERNKMVDHSEQYDVRIALHLGDIVEKDNDIFGDTVNIAARILPFADPGGIVMTSHLYHSTRGQLRLRGTYLGAMRLKNIPERVRVYAVPPPEVDFVRWVIKRRNPINTRLKAAALAVGVAAAWLILYAWGTARAPKAALFYVDSAVTRGAAAESARAAAETVMEEISTRGPSIGVLKWRDNSWVAGLMEQEGIKGPRTAAEMDHHAGQLARRGGLSYYLTGRIEDIGGWLSKKWLVKVRMIDASSQTVVASFSAEGKPAEAAEILVEKIRVWARENIRRTTPPNRERPK